MGRGQAIEQVIWLRFVYQQTLEFCEDCCSVHQLDVIESFDRVETTNWTAANSKLGIFRTSFFSVVMSSHPVMELARIEDR